MNKYQDDKQSLQYRLEDITFYARNNEKNNDYDELQIDIARGRLQELVDKETPMKPNKIKKNDLCLILHGYCECYEMVFNSNKYCPNCGQKLKWE